MPIKGNGDFDKWESQNPAGEASRADPGGKDHHDSDLALKTNGRSIAKNMPLLIEFAGYGGSQKKDGQRCYIAAH